nr:unnamed protein product [Spirometra erinaceieuropaei]
MEQSEDRSGETLACEINATFLAMEYSGGITLTDRPIARPQDTILAGFYGLPKVHKEGAPLRPVMTLRGTPKYGLNKWPFWRLKFLTAESDTTVSSSAQVMEKRKGDLAIKAIGLLLQSKYNEPKNCLGHVQVLQLLKFCLRTYFTFDGTIYKRGKGDPMGPPIPVPIAEAVLQCAVIPDVQFTMEEEENNQLVFLDVLVYPEDCDVLKT